MNRSIFKEHPTITVGPYLLKNIPTEDEEQLEVLCAFRPPDRRAPAKELLEKVEKAYHEETGINWGIYAKNQLIGTIGFYRGFENEEGEIGYMLLPEFRNKGITTLIAKHLLLFAEQEMQLNSVCAYTDKENHPSQKVLEKIGLKKYN